MICGLYVVVVGVRSQPDITWQPSLFGDEEPAIDRDFTNLQRIQLDADSWVDHAPGWLSSSDRLFHDIVETREWAQRSRRMYDREVLEPRLTSPWFLASGEPLQPDIVEEMRAVLSDRYEVEFDSVGFNLYRDGQDSVAWHGDRIRKEIEKPIVALVSAGEPRRFLLRPKGGGPSTTFKLGDGDLLVTGGLTQRTWEHSVPKVKKAGPRISLAFRHGMDPKAYAGKKVHPLGSGPPSGDG
jgi:alkylated DNA repair dioxygenase AlkB